MIALALTPENFEEDDTLRWKRQQRASRILYWVGWAALVLVGLLLLREIL